MNQEILVIKIFDNYRKIMMTVMSLLISLFITKLLVVDTIAGLIMAPIFILIAVFAVRRMLMTISFSSTNISFNYLYGKSKIIPYPRIICIRRIGWIRGEEYYESMHYHRKAVSRTNGKLFPCNETDFNKLKDYLKGKNILFED